MKKQALKNVFIMAATMLICLMMSLPSFAAVLCAAQSTSSSGLISGAFLNFFSGIYSLLNWITDLLVPIIGRIANR